MRSKYENVTLSSLTNKIKLNPRCFSERKITNSKAIILKFKNIMNFTINYKQKN